MIGEPAKITIIGVDGSKWCVSGPGMGREGVELDESPQGIVDPAPFKTIWDQSAFQEGATFRGVNIEPIDLVLGFNIYGESPGDWEDKESRFLAAFDYYRRATIEYISSSGTRRTLEVCLDDSIKFKSKHDPRISAYSQVDISLRAPFPKWKGDDYVSTFTATGDGEGTVTVANPTDTDLWLRWVVVGGGKWTIPDYDYRGSTRTITTPTIDAAVELTVDTYPLNETYVASDGSNIAGQFYGVDFLYPVPPHTAMREIPVKVEGAEGEASISCVMEQYWKRPFGGRG